MCFSKSILGQVPSLENHMANLKYTFFKENIKKKIKKTRILNRYNRRAQSAEATAVTRNAYLHMQTPHTSSHLCIFVY